MKKQLFILLIVLFGITVSAQEITFEKRIEIDVTNMNTDVNFYGLGKSGFLLSKEDEDNKEMQKLTFTKYNTDMVAKDSAIVNLARKFKFDESFVSKTNAHIFYKLKSSFILITVNFATLEFTKVTGILPKKLHTDKMVVVGDYAYFDAGIKTTPVLFSINWKTAATLVTPIKVPNAVTKGITIENIQALENAKELIVFIKAKGKEVNKTNMYAMKVDENGDRSDPFNISQDGEKNIVSISASKITDGNYIYTGTYSTKSNYTSEGIFIAKGKDESIEYMKFINFLDLKNFLTYLPEKKQEKIEKKKDKKEKAGKEFSISYNIADHDIIEVKDGYMFLGEAYYPTYRTEIYYTTQTVNGVTTQVMHTRQVFDGYQYTHAVLAKFSTAGELVWSNVFEMWPAYKPFFVKRFVSVMQMDDNDTKMVYSSRNKIYLKSVDSDGVAAKDIVSKEIKTGVSGDETKNSISDMEYWYDTYFVASGTQRIKNKENDDVKKKRTVFFVNKIKY